MLFKLTVTVSVTEKWEVTETEKTDSTDKFQQCKSANKTRLYIWLLSCNKFMEL